MQRTVVTKLTNENSVYKLKKENLSYVEILKKYFHLRKQRNPKYSLRQFAKDLELTPPHLSYILRGQRGLSRKKAEVATKVLRLSYKDKITFLQVVSAISGRGIKERNFAQFGLHNSQKYGLISYQEK